VTVVKGPNAPTLPGVEATLDIQVIMAVATNVSTWFWSQRGGFEIDPFLAYCYSLLHTRNAPWTQSISYSDVESDLTTEYKMRVSTELQKVGLLIAQVPIGELGQWIAQCQRRLLLLLLLLFGLLFGLLLLFGVLFRLEVLDSQSCSHRVTMALAARTTARLCNPTGRPAIHTLHRWYA
jgi:hypothetical protein